MNGSRLYLLVFFIVYSISVIGQKMFFNTISVEEGLSNNFVKTIYKDSDGFIWLGTLEGLDRLDGSEIERYSSKILVNFESINVICEDSEKNLWLGTTSGLMYFSKKLEVFNIVKLDTVGNNILSLYYDTKKALYVGTERGLYILDLSTKKSSNILFDNQQSSPSNIITGIAEGKVNDLWFTTGNGLFNYTPSDRSLRAYYSDNKGFNNLRAITKIDDNLYLGAANQGLCSFSLLSHVFSPFIDIGSKIILTLSSNKKDLLFVGTDGNGLKIIDLKSGQVKTISHINDDLTTISSDAVYSFLYDDDSYWVGTFSGGVSYSLDLSHKFKVYSFDKKFSTLNKHIRSFYFPTDNIKCIGTRNGFYYLNEKIGRIEYFYSDMRDNSELQSNIILTIFPYKENFLIGVYGGQCCIFNPRTNKIERFTNSGGINSVYQFDRDKDGNIWLASLNGIYRFTSDLKEQKHFTKSNSQLISDEVFSLKIDSRNRLWAGTMEGVSVIDPNTGKSVFEHSLGSFRNQYKTTYIYEDSKSNIWVCFEKGGLLFFNNDLTLVKNYTTDDGLPDNSVSAIIEDSHRQFWISTLRGFCRLTQSTNTIRTFSLSDGLPGLVFNPAACFKTSDGNLWWGNEKGLVTFHSDDISNNAPNAKIKFTAFYLSRQEVECGPNSLLKESITTSSIIELNRKQNSIGFKFVALNFFFPKENEYSCMLVGYDSTWKALGNQNITHYDNLPAGKYKFKVKLTNDILNENIAGINLVIKKSFFNTIYFYIILLLAMVLLFFYLRKFYFFLKEQIKSGLDAKNLSSEELKYRHSKLSEKTGEEIKTAILNYMENRKAYLKTDLKLSDISNEIGFSQHDISQTLNQYLNQNFADFINKYRIEEFISNMRKNENSKYTLMALAELSGFNSKSSFFRAFKKYTGYTPAEYFKLPKQPLKEE